MDQPGSQPPPRAERRAPARLLYTRDQLLGRTPIWLRRRADKLRLAAHLLVALSLMALSLWWVLGDHVFAGRVLLSVSPGRGVHLGDLAILVFAAIALRSLRSALRLREVRGDGTVAGVHSQDAEVGPAGTGGR